MAKSSKINKQRKSSEIIPGQDPRDSTKKKRTIKQELKKSNSSKSQNPELFLNERDYSDESSDHS